MVTDNVLETINCLPAAFCFNMQSFPIILHKRVQTKDMTMLGLGLSDFVCCKDED